MMNKILFFLLFPVVLYAAPSSEIAWTPEQLSFVKQGNSANGKELSASCAACHGDNGVSQMPDTPSLAGQLATYTFKQLRDYALQKRSHAMMSGIAQGLSEQDSADLAQWFASLPAPKNVTSTGKTEQAEKIVYKGDGKRTLPPCFVCHGSDGQGEKMHIPALAGQRADYLQKTLQSYKSEQRHNDIYSRMRLIAGQLTTQEIKELAEFYQDLK